MKKLRRSSNNHNISPICQKIVKCALCDKYVCEHCSIIVNSKVLCKDRCAQLPRGINGVPPKLDDMKSDKAISQWISCKKCNLHRNRTQVVLGTGNKVNPKIFIVGQSPGETEDKEGTPFVGKVSWHLNQVLKSVGIDREKDCYLTNTVACRPWIPEFNKNVAPTRDQIVTCRPRLIQEFKNVFSSIKVIVLIGKEAYVTWMKKKQLYNTNFSPKTVVLGPALGWQENIPEEYPPVYVVYHPSYIARVGPNAINKTTKQKIVDSWKSDWQNIANYVKEHS